MKYAILFNSQYAGLDRWIDNNYYPKLHQLRFVKYLETDSLENCFKIANNMTSYYKWSHRSLSVGDVVACQNKYSKIWEYHIVRIVGFEVWSAIMSRESPEILFKNL